MLSLCFMSLIASRLIKVWLKADLQNLVVHLFIGKNKQFDKIILVLFLWSPDAL